MKRRMSSRKVYFALLVISAYVVQMGAAGALIVNTDASDHCEPRPNFVGTSTARTLSTLSQQRAERKSCIAAQLRLALYLQESLSCGSPTQTAGHLASLGDLLNFVMANVPSSNLSVVATNTQEVACRVLLSDSEFTALHHLYMDQVSGVSHDSKQQ